MPSSLTTQTLARQVGPDTLRGRSNSDAGLPEEDDPETPTEAAEQFEEVLVRQFVDVMTKGMFSSSLTGEKGGGWMKSQRDRQRSMMTDMITDHLVEAGNLQISEKLTERWGVSNSAETPDASSSDEGIPFKKPVDPLPITPPDTHRTPSNPSPTPEGRHVDHAA